MASSWWIQTNASAVNTVPGPAPMVPVSLMSSKRTMKKCTLCVDRIYNEELPEAERLPACVRACPAEARIFGDIHNPESEVSVLIREQGGYQLMPELGASPSNHYLPRRKVHREIQKDELLRVDNPLKKERLPKPSPDEPALDDVTSW